MTAAARPPLGVLVNRFVRTRRVLAALLCHVAIALVACTPLAPLNLPHRSFVPCGAEPSFAAETPLKRWARFPVDVHLDLSAVPRELRASYREGLELGLSSWAQATEGRIGRFRVGRSRGSSSVTLVLTDEPLPRDALGITELTFSGARILSASVKLRRSRYEGTPFLVKDVANTTVHEMGHVLGIVEHSSSPEDKMYSAGNFGAHNLMEDPLALLTSRDVNTLREAYCR